MMRPCPVLVSVNLAFFISSIVVSETMYHNEFANPVMQPTMPYVLRVTIIGSPSVGKSELMNRLVRHKVRLVSGMRGGGVN